MNEPDKLERVLWPLTILFGAPPLGGAIAYQIGFGPVGCVIFAGVSLCLCWFFRPKG